MTKRRKNLVLKGKFAGSLHPAKLLFGLLKAKKSGVLTLHEGTAHISLYLNSGCVVFDRRGVFADEDFGQFIIARNLTTEQEYRQYKSTARKKKKTPVDLMVHAGILDETETELLAQEFFWRAAPSFFLWRKGDYSFLERSKTRPSEYATLANGAVFILRGIMDKYDPAMMRERLQKRLKNRLKINENNIITPKELEEVTVVADFLAAISEETTLSDLIDEFGDDSKKTIAVAYSLLTLGLLKFSVSDEKKYERSLRRRTDPLSRLFTAAVKSVDQVHARAGRDRSDSVKRPESSEIKDAKDILAALEKGEDVEGALTARLDKLRQVKRIKREMLQQSIQQTDDGQAPAEVLSEQGPEMEAGDLLEPPAPINDVAAESLMTESEIDEPLIADSASIEATPSTQAASVQQDIDVEIEEDPLAPLDPGANFFSDEIKTESELFLDEAQEAGASQVDAMENGEGTVVFDFGDDAMSAEEFLDTVDTNDKYDPNIYKRTEKTADDITSVSFTPGESAEAIITALRRFCDQEKWKDADKAFTELQMRGFDSADILALGGWARYHRPGDDPFAQGATLIQKGIDNDPKLDIPYMYMGRLYMEEGDHSMAELYFIRALEVNKDCFEAKELMKKLYEL